MNYSNKRRFPDDGRVQEYMHPLKNRKIALYLDNNTPIRTVEVSNIEDHICPGYLRAYFECKIGPVSNVIIINCKTEEKQKCRIGYVTFALAEDAAMSIFDANLIDCKFNIKQASNAFQPSIDPNARKFVEINNDCLKRIASFLNTIDIINLGLASRGLESFVKHEIFAKRTHFVFGGVNGNDLSVNKKNLPIILQTAGDFFQSLEWVLMNDRHIDELQQHCKNVTALNLVAPYLHLDSIERNQDWFRKLTSLKIEDAAFFDIHIKIVIGAATQLESLQSINCFNIRGDFLSEWKDSQLTHLRIAQCPAMLPSNINDFQRNNKLFKFSSDTFDSFVMCLSLQTPYLETYTELGLAVNGTTDEKLDLLNFNDLKQLDKIHLKSSFYNDLAGIDVTVAKNFNNIFVAMSPIHSLSSLTVEHIVIDADTFKCIGSIPNLREVNLKSIYNGVGTELYSMLRVHLPHLAKLTMSMVDTREHIDVNAICDMLFGLVDLRYLSHSNMTWELLNEIRNVQMIRRRPSIEIGISPMLFHRKRVDEVVATSEGTVKISLIV